MRKRRTKCGNGGDAVTALETLIKLRQLKHDLWSNAMDCAPRPFLNRITLSEMRGGFYAYHKAFRLVENLVREIEEEQ